MIDRLKLKLKIRSRSRYVMAARNTMRRMGVKRVTMIVYECPLDREIPIIETRLPVDISTVSAGDIEEGHYLGIKLASEDDPEQHNEALRRLSSGDICLVAKSGDKVTGFVWVYMRKRKYEPAIEKEITLGDDERLVYDNFVFHKFRGTGIGKKLAAESARLVKSKGYSRSMAYIESDNIASIKMCEAVGFRPAKAIKCSRILGCKRTREWPVFWCTSAEKRPGGRSQMIRVGEGR